MDEPNDSDNKKEKDIIINIFNYINKFHTSTLNSDIYNTTTSSMYNVHIQNVIYIYN